MSLKITRLMRGQIPPLPYSIHQGLISKLFSAIRKSRKPTFSPKADILPCSQGKKKAQLNT